LHRGYENPSVATLLGVLIAAQPADEMHRFGHGKAEAIAAMFQIVLISISALSTSVGKHKKGDLVEVQDRPHNSKWTDRKGERYAAEIVSEEVLFF
jgi:hypothetical protein